MGVKASSGQVSFCRFLHLLIDHRRSLLRSRHIHGRGLRHAATDPPFIRLVGEGSAAYQMGGKPLIRPFDEISPFAANA